jgi:hypothetical protein
MELLLIVLVLVAFALGASLVGHDSRLKFDDEPHRAI